MPKNRINFTNDFVLNDSKIGIGTANPTQLLQVGSGTTSVVITSSGNLGIGTTNPSTTLDVTGNVRVTSVGAASSENILQTHYRNNGGSLVYQNQVAAASSTGNILFAVTNQPDSLSPNLVYVISDDDARSLVSVSTTSVRIRDSVSIGGSSVIGNSVSIGTSARVGTFLTAGTYIQTPIVSYISAGAASTSQIVARHYTDNLGSLVFERGDAAPLGAGTSNQQIFTITSGDVDGLIYAINDSNANTAFSVTTGGNIGVGTTTPNQKLSVIGSASITGNLGIGTTTPGQKLDVIGSASITGNLGIGITNPTSQLSVANDIGIGRSIFDSTGVSGVNQYVLTSTPTGILWQSVTAPGVGAISGINITQDTTDADRFLPFLDISSGTTANAYVVPTNLTYNPFTNNLGVGTDKPLGIGTNFTVVRDGSFVTAVTIGATVGSGNTEKVQIRSLAQDNGAMDFVGYDKYQLFSLSSSDSEGAFRVNRYSGVTTTAEPLFLINEVGITTVYNDFTTNTLTTVALANTVGSSSSIGADIYGIVNVRAPFSTSTSYVSIEPKFDDFGALSFQSPIGAAQTDRVTQLFSISNNIGTSIFRINDLNTEPIFEASITGNIGIGTTSPQRKLEVVGSTRITSVGSTPNEQIDIRHYRNVAEQVLNYTGIGLTDNRGALSFDGTHTFVGFGATVPSTIPVSLFAISNDVNDNVFSVAGYTYFSGGRDPAIDVTSRSRVGIGITNPNAKLEVNGNLRVTSVGSTVGEKIDLNHYRNIADRTQNYIGIGLTDNRGALSFDGTSTFVGFGATVPSTIPVSLFAISNDVNDNVFSVSGYTYFSGSRDPAIDVTSRSRVGIGTTNPRQKLDVIGNALISGDVGIGTTNPRVALDVVGNANISGVTTFGLAALSNPVVNSTMSFELTNDTTLTVRVRGADGTVRTGTISLS